jgi:beta-galactosidase
MRETKCFDDSWRFSLSDDDDACLLEFDDSTWETLTLPHDWSIGKQYERTALTGGGGGYVPSGIGWYRKVIDVPLSWLDKWVYLYFDGVYMNSTVWVNGRLAGERPYGYIGFGYDITGLIKEGINIIAVRADCSKEPSSRWYTGCGIYRHTWLTVSEKTHVLPWGSFIKTRLINNNEAEIEYELKFMNTMAELTVSTEITDERNIICASAETKIVSGGENIIVQKLTVQNPGLWFPESPVLYNITSKLKWQGAELDNFTTQFGIRECKYIPGRGFFLNDKMYKFKGVCLHHDGGVCGAAVPESILIRRLGMLKEMGCNAIRTSHNPFASEFYDICDRMGFFVMDEVFDTWDVHKAPHDYASYFKDWWKKDTEDFILRDRNHPSIVMWSMGNEISAPNTKQFENFLELFHRLDPTRLVTCGVPAARQECDEKRAVLDIAGYNDGGGACFLYEWDHKKRPWQLMVATESPHSLQTRGFYRTLTTWEYKSNPRMEIPNLTEKELFTDGKAGYFSSYDNCCARINIRGSWALTEVTPYVCGEFRWTGIDYYGEVAWPLRLHDSGVIDTANLPKDHYYLYQSMWRSAESYPMIHILPHWTHPSFEKGTVIPVWVYTNCEEAELFLNDRSLGRKIKGDARNLAWDIPWEPGKLKALAYQKGREAAEKTVFTAGDPEQVVLTGDYSKGLSAGEVTLQITAGITDATGTTVPYSDNAVHFMFQGALLLGTENGNTLDHTPLKSHVRRAFHGLCTAVLYQLSEKTVITAAALLGDKVFAGEVRVCAAVSTVILQDGRIKPGNNESSRDKYEIFYTLDGSLPSRLSKPYTEPFVLNKTTRVRAVVYQNDKQIFLLEELFIKGIREPFIEQSHNVPVLKELPPGKPLSDKLAGLWSEKEWYCYSFEKDGSLYRVLNSQYKQLLGYWWYDFPSRDDGKDDNAGEGEIWFLSGEKQKMKLVNREANEFLLDNTQWGMGTIYDHQDEMRFSRFQDFQPGGKGTSNA